MTHILDSAIDKELESVLGYSFKVTQGDEMTLQSLFLTFTNGAAYSFECSSSGEGVTVSNRGLDLPTDYGFGQLIQENISSKGLWKKFIGKRFSRFEITDSDGFETGLSLEFEGFLINVLNIGDTLIVTPV